MNLNRFFLLFLFTLVFSTGSTIVVARELEKLPNEFRIQHNLDLLKESTNETFDAFLEAGFWAVLTRVHKNGDCKNPPTYALSYVTTDNGLRVKNLYAARMTLENSQASFFIYEPKQKTAFGHIEENSSIFYPSFKIMGPDGKVLADGIGDVFGTAYTIKDPTDHHTIVELSRNWLPVFAEWTVKILDQKSVKTDKIRPIVLLLAAVIHMDRAGWSNIECEGK